MSDSSPKVTEPGVYALSDEDYHADPVPEGSLAASGALLLLPPSCPAKFAYQRVHGRPPKRAYDLGHAAHRLVLGAGLPLVKIDAEEWRSKAVKAEVEAAYAAGQVPLRPSEWEQVHEMARVLREHPLAGPLLRPGSGVPEQSIFWRDRPTGIWRRARLDWLPNPAPGQRMIVPDYKTAVSAHPDAIDRAIDQFGYHVRAAWYLDGMHALGLAPEDAVFVLVVQEKTPPYVVTVAEIDGPTMRVGRRKARQAIDIYVRCTETGRWPGYADDVVLSGLPTYAMRRAEEDLEDA